MKRLALAPTAIFVGVVVSSCAVGVRGSATDVTETSATLNGKVLSTTGGPGSYFIEYSPVAEPGFPFAETTPTRSIDFVAKELHPVSEPADELWPGRTQYYRACAEDSENPGDPFCSPWRGFRTVGDSVVGTGVRAVSEDLTEDFEYDIGSGTSGQDPNGQFLYRSPTLRGFVGIPTCLAVDGNRAVIGLETFDPARPADKSHGYNVVVDGGPTGDDMMGGVGSSGPATDCAGVPDNVPLSGFSGRSIVVTDEQPQPSAN